MATGKSLRTSLDKPILVATATGKPEIVKNWVAELAYVSRVPLRCDFNSGVGSIVCPETEKDNIKSVVQNITAMKYQLQGNQGKVLQVFPL